MTFTLRYPRENDPYYLLTEGDDAWRFTNKEHALNAYNAGLRLSQLRWEEAHPGEYRDGEKSRAKRDWQKTIQDAKDELERAILNPPPTRVFHPRKSQSGEKTT